VRVVIEGFDLPGTRFCDRDGAVFDGVHVGVQVGGEPFELVSGDAASARWQLDVDVVRGRDGELDFRGPSVHGRRGERFLYLTWGRVHDGTFDMFRRAKLMLSAVNPRLIASVAAGGSLVGTVRLTDDRGGPRCARVDEPDLVWRVD
jgi:hypothetical protein